MCCEDNQRNSISTGFLFFSETKEEKEKLIKLIINDATCRIQEEGEKEQEEEESV